MQDKRLPFSLAWPWLAGIPRIKGPGTPHNCMITVLLVKTFVVCAALLLAIVASQPPSRLASSKDSLQELLELNKCHPQLALVLSSSIMHMAFPRQAKGVCKTHVGHSPLMPTTNINRSFVETNLKLAQLSHNRSLLLQPVFTRELFF